MMHALNYSQYLEENLFIKDDAEDYLKIIY